MVVTCSAIVVTANAAPIPEEDGGDPSTIRTSWAYPGPQVYLEIPYFFGMEFAPYLATYPFFQENYDSRRN